MMVKLIIQRKTPQKTKNKTGAGTTTSSVCLVKVLELFLKCPILELAYMQEL
jgi:hypothetical protein